MRIIEVIIEATDPRGVNTVVGNHREDPNMEGDNKTITGVNIKATADNLLPPTEAIIIITMAITEADVVMAVAETISDPAVMGEAIIEAIIITNTINITHMMNNHRSNNMANHAHFVVVLIILLNIALKENMTSMISWRKCVLAPAINTRMAYINNREHDNPHELPKENSEGSLETIYTEYTHADFTTKLLEEIEKLEYINQHFQDHEKIY